MDKGIRPAAKAKFLELLPTRVNDTKGNTAFRKTVIAYLEEEFGITHSAGATHYNSAFIHARELAKTDPVLAAQLVGLGRAEDKKGGRKKKVAASTAEVKGTVIPGNPALLLQNFINASVVQPTFTPALPEGAVLLSEGIKESNFTHTVGVNPDAEWGMKEADAGRAVRKVSDGTVVAEGLTLEAAEELIAKAAAAKKAKLELVV